MAELSPSASSIDTVTYGVVVIGRNEGERLRKCLTSIDPRSAPVVYVDSGSTDGSVELASNMGADVILLDMSTPFTAARARNEGFARLLLAAPQVDLVQFVDGDCEVHTQWIVTACRFLDSRPEVVAVSGRRRERFPERSIFNAMCDMDWEGSPGSVRHFGGDVMIRSKALSTAGGYNGSLIAGEEPELSIRLRGAGWTIWRLNAPMTLHDANILHWQQWWRRCVRTGYAFAEGFAMNGKPPEQHWRRETISAALWGGALPLVAMLALFWAWQASAALCALYPLQMGRLFLESSRSRRLAAVRAVLLVIGKFPECAGVSKYWLARLRGRHSRLIEYK